MIVIIRLLSVKYKFVNYFVSWSSSNLSARIVHFHLKIWCFWDHSNSRWFHSGKREDSYRRRTVWHGNSINHIPQIVMFVKFIEQQNWFDISMDFSCSLPTATNAAYSVHNSEKSYTGFQIPRFNTFLGERTFPMVFWWTDQIVAFAFKCFTAGTSYINCTFSVRFGFEVKWRNQKIVNLFRLSDKSEMTDKI